MSRPGDNHDTPVSELLSRLQESGAGDAWSEFLDRYSSTIFQIALQYAPDSDSAGDCYLYVCEKLSENRADRLQRFDPTRGASFQTWLTAVVNNLCIDWHRNLYGRQTLPAAIQRLSELEQWTFRYRIQESLDLQSCLLLLRRRFPNLSRPQLSAALKAIHKAIPPKQRWRISVLAQRRQSKDPGTDAESARDGDGLTPDHLAHQQQRAEALKEALSNLTSQQRLLLRLRYEQDLGLDEIARIAGLDSLHQARRLIMAALKDLQKHLRAQDISA